jgi:TonB-dependent SusC/RagA subfamily outer membrane receptor
VVAALGARVLDAVADVVGAAAPVARWAALPRSWMPWLAAGSTGLAALLLVGGLLHLHRRARHWRRIVWRARPVWVTRSFGPAVVGLFRPRPVLPAWALRLDDDAVELILTHERAHARAHDPALLLAAATLAVLAPWNPAVWVQLRRLRAAVEVDCDARVLRGGVSASRYGRLLVEMRARGAPAGFATPALLDSPESLERRLVTMFTKKTTLARALPTLVAAGLLVIAACETPAPTTPAAVEPERASSVDAATADGVLQAVEIEVTPEKPDPLVLVDGEPIDLSLAKKVEPSEIYAIEVIKGGAAGEVYGDTAAGGVVRITTFESKARALGVPPAELKRRTQAERAAKGDERVKDAVDETVVKVRPATGTLRVDRTGVEGSSGTLRIRGTSDTGPGKSLTFDKTDALVIVDGTAVDGTASLTSLTPSDIERIEVIKGDAAVRSYGDRGARGVIVITTKAGGSGGG